MGAEQGVLGCVLEDPSCLAQAEAQIPCPEVFYLGNHQIIWKTLCAMGRNGGIDEILLREHLRKSRKLKEVGGDEYIGQLRDKVLSVANLPNYLDILREKWTLRRYMTQCEEVIRRAQNFDGHINDFIFSSRSDLAEAMAEDRQESEHSWSVKQLSEFNAERDPNAMIGMKDGKTTRYLCRGYGAWLIGPSGVGKSSLIHQTAFSWALGRPMCGITPVRPMRILVVQAENDEGDAAEMTQGILRSFGIDDFPGGELDALNENVHIITERRTVGDRFCTWLGKQIERYRAEIVFADPFLSFAGVDVSRQDQCTKFLRAALNPVLSDSGAVLFAAHHTGKPKPQKDMKSWTAVDFAYAGIGSSELVNWARAVMVLLPMGDNRHYELKLAKRGLRAGATHPDGEFTTSIFLRHADDRIFWEQVEAPERVEDKAAHPGKGRPSQIERIKMANKASFLAACKPEGEGFNEIAKRLMAWSASNELGRIDLTMSTAKRAINALLENSELNKDASGRYTKGPNA